MRVIGQIVDRKDWEKNFASYTLVTVACQHIRLAFILYNLYKTLEGEVECMGYVNNDNGKSLVNHC